MSYAEYTAIFMPASAAVAVHLPISAGLSEEQSRYEKRKCGFVERVDLISSFQDAPYGADPESIAPQQYRERWILRCAIAHHSSRSRAPE
jgi:hypothetical protein